VERAPTIPKDGTPLLAAGAAPGQLDHFSTLALQQRGQQSASRKGGSRGHNVVFSVFHKRLFIRGLTVPPTDSDMGPSSYAFRGISDLLMSIDRHEVRLRKDHHGVDLISDALPFGRLWYAERNALDYAKFRSRSHGAVIRVYDDAGNVIEMHEHAGEFEEC
jgi:hypothetical protein